MTFNNGNSNGNGDAAQHLSAATKLRRHLETDEIIVAPGVYDGFSARIANEVGLDCIYMVSEHLSSLRPTILTEFGTDWSWYLCV
jgi:hypothetical protein